LFNDNANLPLYVCWQFIRIFCEGTADLNFHFANLSFLRKLVFSLPVSKRDLRPFFIARANAASPSASE
jgi:hypothetical protein